MIKDVHLLDLVGRDKLEEILYFFTQATGVASIITEVNGEPLPNRKILPSCAVNFVAQPLRA